MPHGQVQKQKSIPRNMVKMVCIDCGLVEFEAESLREMLTLMMPHYFDAHQDIMSGQSKESRETWMQRFTDAFNGIADAE